MRRPTQADLPELFLYMPTIFESGGSVVKASSKSETAVPRMSTKSAGKIKKSLRPKRDHEVQKSSLPRPRPEPTEPVVLSAEMVETRSNLVKMLADMRAEIDHEVNGARDRDFSHINDTSDIASDSAEGELNLRIAESETVEAEEIESAIEKIDNGTYGICDMCNKPIGAERIKFLPYVTHCVRCQEMAEFRRKNHADSLDDLAEGSEPDSENN